MFPYGNTGRITGHFLTTIDINVINLYRRIICFIFHCCCRQGCNHFLGGGVGEEAGGGGWGAGWGEVRTPNFFIAPQFWTVFNVGDLSFVLNVFLFSLKSRFFKISLSTIHQIERFEVRNSENFLEGSPSPLPKPILRSFSDFGLDFPTNRTLFSVIIWTATDRNVELIVYRHEKVNDNDVILIFVVVFGIIIIVVVVIITTIPRKITIIGHPCTCMFPYGNCKTFLGKVPKLVKA